MPNIGEKIKELRLERGMTLEQVGNIVGVGKSTVRKWEVGLIENMRRDKIERLAIALGVSPDFFFQETISSSPAAAPPALSSQEEDALALYRRLDRDDQIEVTGVMKGMLMAEKYKKGSGSQTA